MLRITTVSTLLLFALALSAAAAQAPDAPAAKPSVAASDDETRPTVLITGANRGIGLEFAKQYANDGWDVIGTARRPDAATALAETGATVVALDVTDSESVEALVATLDGRPIDLLINNAGVSARAGAIDELDLERAERAIAVNLLGPMRITAALLPNLKEGDRKTVVGISSRLGSIEGNTAGGYYGYRESKTGLNMFMRSLAADLRSDGFTCVVMSPGWVRTAMGGPRAPLSTTDSVNGMRTVIAALTPEQSGQFISHDGERIDW